MPEMTPRAFSFNSPHGACPDCQGLGATVDFDPQRIVPDESKSLAGGAIAPWARGDRKLVREALQALSRDFGIDLDVPFARLPRKAREILLFGAAKSASGQRDGAVPRALKFEGLLPNLRRRYEDGSWAEQEELEPYRSLRPCATCRGQRLKTQSLSVKVKGRTISDYVNLPIAEALEVFDGLQLTDREAIIAERILKEIQERLQFLNGVGVGYLTLGRSAATLSGGEGQRIRLATQIGANLTGVLYVLDEPSIGLHQRDNRKLLATLSRLRDLGNTVIVVEHDEETIRTADYVIDLGPGAGDLGGHVIFQGTPAAPDGSGRRSGRDPGLVPDRRLSDRRPRDPDAQGAAAGAEGRDGHPRRAREQSQEPRRQDSARRADGGDRRERIREVDARQRHPVQIARQDALPGGRRAGRTRSDRRHRPHRQSDRDRSVADRTHAAQQPGDLHRAVHLHPRSLRDDARCQGARLQAGPLFVQREGRPLRGVPGRRRDCHRDALPARRVRHVRAVQGRGATTARRSKSSTAENRSPTCSS